MHSSRHSRDKVRRERSSSRSVHSGSGSSGGVRRRTDSRERKSSRSRRREESHRKKSRGSKERDSSRHRSRREGSHHSKRDSSEKSSSRHNSGRSRSPKYTYSSSSKNNGYSSLYSATGEDWEEPVPRNVSIKIEKDGRPTSTYRSPSPLQARRPRSRSISPLQARRPRSRSSSPLQARRPLSPSHLESRPTSSSSSHQSRALSPSPMEVRRPIRCANTSPPPSKRAPIVYQPPPPPITIDDEDWDSGPIVNVNIKRNFTYLNIGYAAPSKSRYTTRKRPCMRNDDPMQSQISWGNGRTTTVTSSYTSTYDPSYANLPSTTSSYRERILSPPPQRTSKVDTFAFENWETEKSFNEFPTEKPASPARAPPSPSIPPAEPEVRVKTEKPDENEQGNDEEESEDVGKIQLVPLFKIKDERMFDDEVPPDSTLENQLKDPHPQTVKTERSSPTAATSNNEEPLKAPKIEDTEREPGEITPEPSPPPSPVPKRVRRNSGLSNPRSPPPMADEFNSRTGMDFLPEEKFPDLARAFGRKFNKAKYPKKKKPKFEKGGLMGFDVNIDTEEPEPLLPPPPPIPTLSRPPHISPPLQSPPTIFSPAPAVAVPTPVMPSLGLLPHQIATLLPHQLAALAQLVQQAQGQVPIAQVVAPNVPFVQNPVATNKIQQNSFTGQSTTLGYINASSSSQLGAVPDNNGYPTTGNYLPRSTGYTSVARAQTSNGGYAQDPRRPPATAVAPTNYNGGDENWEDEPTPPPRRGNPNEDAVAAAAAAAAVLVRKQGIIIDYGHGSSNYS